VRPIDSASPDLDPLVIRSEWTHAPARDLHAGFRDPRSGAADELELFLEEADRLPGICAIQRAMRRALGLLPGMRLLDAGCGIGLETARLAWDHPEVEVTGLDRNAELLEIAQRRIDPPPHNLSWLEGNLAALDLPEASFDAVRTERVLMYLTDAELARALDDLVRLLATDGRLALFELDYGATILTPGAAGDPVLRRVDETLIASMPQPLAGRRLPGLLAARGMRDVAAAPFSFSVSEPVWRRIVGHTLTASWPFEPRVAEWLAERSAAAARGDFVAAFTGVLTTARR
jgi:SAM-dependent methyltransferase